MIFNNRYWRKGTNRWLTTVLIFPYSTTLNAIEAENSRCGLEGSFSSMMTMTLLFITLALVWRILCLKNTISKQKDEKDALMLEQQQEKQDAIERVNRGIIHELNNILYGLSGFTRLAIDENDKTNSLHEYLTHIDKGHKKASEAIKKIASFHELDNHGKTSQTKLQDILNAMDPALNKLTPKNVRLGLSINKQCPAIEVTPGQIKDIVMHLFQNALDAIGESEGNIEINLTETFHSNKDSATAKKCIQLAIIDSGCGISDEIKEKVFDPYFSTKPKSQAKGLGLSISRGLTLTNNGTIKLISQKGEGTTVSIYFPIG